MLLLCLLVFFHPIADHEEEDSGGEEGDDGIAEDAAVALDDAGVGSLIGEPSEEGQHAVPDEGTEGGVEREREEIHLAETCGDGDELADDRDETAHEGGDHAVVVEILLGAFHLLAREAQHVPPAAVDEGIDDGAAEPAREEIVDEGAEEGAEGAEEHHEPYLHAALTLGIGGDIDRRGNDHLGGEGDERALDSHEAADGPIVHVGVVPVECRGHEARRGCVATYRLGHADILLCTESGGGEENSHKQQDWQKTFYLFHILYYYLDNGLFIYLSL